MLNQTHLCEIAFNVGNKNSLSNEPSEIDGRPPVTRHGQAARDWRAAGRYRRRPGGSDAGFQPVLAIHRRNAFPAKG